MNAYEKMKKEWKVAFDQMQKSEILERIRRGDFKKEHYIYLMKQIFHHARENPQIQAFATSFFRGEDRQHVKMFFRHATAEIGHDQLAAEDAKRCGADISNIEFEMPNPSTAALVAFAFYQIQFRNPIGYLGYLFFLEYTPVQSGGAYIDIFKKCGIPEEATEFFKEHSEVDVAHCKMMEKYVDRLVRTESDMQEVLFAIRSTAKLYLAMIAEAFEKADKKEIAEIRFDELSRSEQSSTSRRSAA